MKFSLETIKDLFSGECMEEYGIEVVEDVEWDGGCDKYINGSIVFKISDKHYVASALRSGSYYTDWYTHYFEDSNNMVECPEVHKVKIVTEVWEAV